MARKRYEADDLAKANAENSTGANDDDQIFRQKVAH